MADWRNRFVKSKTMFDFHAWMGLIVGICMIVIGFSGAIAVFKNEIEWLVTPEARAEPSAENASIDEIVINLERKYPEQQLLSLYFQQGPRWAHTAYIPDPNGTWFRLLIDPQSGEVRKKQRPMQSISFILRHLHLRLLLADWGRIFVGIFGVTLFLSAVTGLYIYRNWIKSLFQLRRGAARRIFYSDLHKVIGFWSLIFILIIAFTGAYLGLESIYYKVKREWFPEPTQETLAVSEEKLASYGDNPQRLLVSQLLEVSTQHFPKMKPLGISFPRKPESPIVVYGDHRHALIAEWRSRVYLDPYSGEILKAEDPRKASIGGKIYNSFEPLHYGYWGDAFGVGFEYIIKTLWFILGMTPGTLAITGAMMWFIRQQRIKKRQQDPVRRKSASEMLKESVQEIPIVTIEELEYATAPSAPATAETSGSKRRPWLWFTLSLLPFLLAGYVMQAMIWREEWTLTGILLVHWIIKPISIGTIVFPITIVLVIISHRAVRSVKHGKRKTWFATIGGILLGIWYCFLLSLLN